MEVHSKDKFENRNGGLHVIICNLYTYDSYNFTFRRPPALVLLHLRVFITTDTRLLLLLRLSIITTDITVKKVPTTPEAVDTTASVLSSDEEDVVEIFGAGNVR